MRRGKSRAYKARISAALTRHGQSGSRLEAPSLQMPDVHLVEDDNRPLLQQREPDGVLLRIEECVNGTGGGDLVAPRGVTAQLRLVGDNLILENHHVQPWPR